MPLFFFMKFAVDLPLKRYFLHHILGIGNLPTTENYRKIVML